MNYDPRRMSLNAKHAMFLCLLAISPLFTIAQNDSLTLIDCHVKAQQLSPLQQQTQYFETVEVLKEKILATLNLPQVNFRGQLTYQSDVFTLPFSLPGQELPIIPKTQYMTALDVNQRIYDGGLLRQRSAENALQTKLGQQQLAVELYQIKHIINDLFFSILLLDQQEEVLTILLKTLEERLVSIEAAVKHGVSTSDGSLTFQKQIITVEQQLTQLTSRRRSLLEMLGDWIGEKEIDKINLAIPDMPATKDWTLARPELKLFELQSQQLEIKKEGLSLRNQPKIAAFATLGLGNPNPLNFLEVSPSPFYQIGLRLNWTMLDYKRTDRERALLGIQQKILQSKQENFEMRISNSLIRDAGEVKLTDQLAQADKRIVDLQAQIVEQRSSQLNNGIATSADYIEELNALTKAKLQLEYRKLTKLQTQINALTKAGQL